MIYDLLKADVSDATKHKVIADCDEVLGLDLIKAADALKQQQPEQKADAELECFIQEKIAARSQAKKEKDFATADAIREELLSRGVAIKDTREGTVWELV